MIRAASFMTMLVLLFACSSEKQKPREPLSPEQAQEVAKLIRKARAIGDQHDTRRRAALAAHHAQRKTIVDLGRCRIDINKPSGAESSRSAWIAMGNDPTYNILNVARLDDLASTVSPRRDDLETHIGWLRPKIKATDSPADTMETAKQLTSTFWDHDATIVADEWTLPRMDSALFTPGRIRGRMYIWSYVDEAIVCAADVDATSSETVKVNMGAESELSADLQINALRDGLSKMVAIRKPSASKAKPASSSIEDDVFTAITESGVTVPLPHATARWWGGKLDIMLGESKPPPCGDAERDDNRYYAGFQVRPGPGGKYFTGGPFGTSAVGGERRGNSSGFAPSHVRIEIEPFAKGDGYIRGRLTTPHFGAGTFRAKMCADPPPAVHAQPVEVPNAPVAGLFVGKRFTAKTVLARIRPSGDARVIGVIRMFPKRGVKCRDFQTSGDKETVVQLTDFGGALSTAPILAAPQPVSVSFQDGLYGWVQFDKLRFGDGDRISGRFAAASGPTIAVERKTNLGGVFTARLCPE